MGAKRVLPYSQTQKWVWEGNWNPRRGEYRSPALPLSYPHRNHCGRTQATRQPSASACRATDEGDTASSRGLLRPIRAPSFLCFESVASPVSHN